MPDDVPLIHVQDDMDAVTPQPGALVEAVARSARLLHDREDREDGALGRRPSAAELEQDRLVHRAAREHGRDRRRPNLEVPATRRRRDDDTRPASLADGCDERAAIQLVEAHASPPPAGECEPGCKTETRHGDEYSTEQQHRAGARTREIGAGKPAAER